MPPKQQLSGDNPPSMEQLITAESWLLFDILEHKREQMKWLLFPPDSWEVDPDYRVFQTFVKN